MSAKIHSQDILHQSRVFKLVEEKITLPNQVTTSMTFVQHPGAAAMVPMADHLEVILIKQYRHALRDTIWEIPAGTLDPRENPLDCAKRELVEEIGYSADTWQELTCITPVPGYSDERIHIFLASDLLPAEQNLDKDELLDVHHLRLEAALDMVQRGDIRDGKTIVGLMLADEWLQKNR
jgi:ADP-ribose pyrophosphatase